MPDLITTGSQLRAARRAHGYSLRSLAAALGMSKDTINRFENSEAPLPVWFARAWRDLEAEGPVTTEELVSDA